MNRDKLRAMHNWTVRIRPLVWRRVPDGPWLTPIDDEWLIDANTHRPNAVVRLHNLATGHFVDLYPDSVYEYKEPNFVILRERLALVGYAVTREPIADPRLAYAAAARFAEGAMHGG